MYTVFLEVVYLQVSEACKKFFESPALCFGGGFDYLGNGGDRLGLASSMAVSSGFSGSVRQKSQISSGGSSSEPVGISELEVNWS